MPAVSVVLPVYNAERTIERAVRSVLNQTLPDIELIVVDDGSTDATASVLSRINDQRLKVISNEHGGVAIAANIGTAHAQADFIARMDADDFAYPQRLQLQQRLIQDTGCDVVGTRVRILQTDGAPTTTMKRYERWINNDTATGDQILALRFVEFPLVNPTIMAKRAYFEFAFRNDELPEDYDLMLRAAAAGMTFAKTQNVLLDWYDGTHRLTRTDARYSIDAFMQCRRQYLRTGPLAGVNTVDLCGVGQTGKPWLRWLQQQKITVRRAFDVSPKKIGTQIHGVRVLDYDEMPLADSVPLMIAVGADGTRDIINHHIMQRGYQSGRNAWFVA